MKTFGKRILLLLICQCCATFLIIYAFEHRILGPRGLGISGLVLFAGFMVTFVLIARKSQKEALATAPPPGTPIDEATRKQRLRYIRGGKVAIVVLALSLVYGLSQFQGRPVWALVVAGLINVVGIAAIVQMVVRLKKSLN